MAIEKARNAAAKEQQLTKENAWKPLANEPVDCYMAFSLYFQANGNISHTDIATDIGCAPAAIGRWKEEWRWDERVSMFESDLARGKVENMQHMELLQAVVIADGFEDYGLLVGLWQATVARVAEALAQPFAEEGVTLGDVVAAIKSLAQSRQYIDQLGRNATLLPTRYSGLQNNRANRRENSGVVKEKPKQLSWGSEGGKLAVRDDDD